jgi:hypothetical protein
VGNSSQKVGVIDRQGKLIVDTLTYDKISGGGVQHFYFRRGQTAGRMNNRFEELWSMNANSVTPLEKTTQFFMISNTSGPYDHTRQELRIAWKYRG